MRENCSQNLKLKGHLNTASLGSSLKLTPNGLLSFHWSNWKDSCNYVKNQLNQKCSISRLEKINDEFNELKNRNIWLKNKHKTIKATMFELYENYLDPRIRMNWFDLKDEILISTHNESGPYMTLTSMRWLDKDTYTSFVRRKIIMGFVPKRNFRLDLDIPVKGYFDNLSLKPSAINFHQANKDGLILKFKYSSDINKALNSEHLYIQMNLKPFCDLARKNYKEIIQDFSNFERRDFSDRQNIVSLETNVFNMYGNDNAVKLCNGKEFYIFVKYSDLIMPDHFTESIRPGFQNMVNEIEKEFQAQLKTA